MKTKIKIKKIDESSKMEKEEIIEGLIESLENIKSFIEFMEKCLKSDNESEQIMAIYTTGKFYEVLENFYDHTKNVEMVSNLKALLDRESYHA